jgi:hypothetical protein
VVLADSSGETSTAANQITLSYAKTTLRKIQAYADDAAAGVAGLTVGDIYQTSGAGAAPLNVAGILMIKQ